MIDILSEMIDYIDLFDYLHARMSAFQIYWCKMRCFEQWATIHILNIDAPAC
jgi:hypothetical protein